MHHTRSLQQWGIQALSVGLALIGLLLTAAPVQAHQPFFEDADIPADQPWPIADPAVSTAIYATLESSTDLDLFTFEGEQGQMVLLSILIPQIAGQEDFVPMMALIGPGLSEGTTAIPPAISIFTGEGVKAILPPGGPPSTFFEPFTRTSYWERQEQRVILPADGRYRIAIWHPLGKVGRYVFVIGQEERLGGDLAFPFKMRRYWTLVGSSPPVGPSLGVVLLWTLLAFLAGSLPFSVWMGRLIARSDVRRYGDGNPGAANAWRAGGWRAGVPAVLLDYLKGAVPVGLAHFEAGLSGWPLVPVALAPIVGHAFSPLLRFRGGKAVAVTFGVWSGLTLWAGPTVLGLTLLLAIAVNSTDAWSAVLGMLALLVYLLGSGGSSSLLVIWVGNLLVVLGKHWLELRNPPRLRPWLRQRLGRPG